jgi:hypothetical protein
MTELTGYVERGLDADLARWFAREPRASIAPTVRPVQPFLFRLPDADASALGALDRRVRSEALPELWGLDITEDWTYGFDFAANGIEVRDEKDEIEEVWPLALDGGGNHYVLRATGQVAVWNHETGAIEGHTGFDNLDLFLWSVVRLAAVHDGRIGRDEIEADFEALAQPGALLLLDRD